MIDFNEVHGLANETATLMRKSGVNEDGVQFLVRHHLEGLAKYNHTHHHTALQAWFVWCDDNNVPSDVRLKFNSTPENVFI